MEQPRGGSNWAEPVLITCDASALQTALAEATLAKKEKEEDDLDQLLSL